VLTVLILIGMAAAVLYFHKDRPNEFDREFDEPAAETSDQGA